jgi:hypothetical protein
MATETVRYENFERGDDPFILGDASFAFSYGVLQEAQRLGWKTAGYTNLVGDQARDLGLIEAKSWTTAVRNNINRCDAVIIFAKGTLKSGSTALDLMINTCKERHRHFRIVLDQAPPVGWLKEINPRVINVTGVGSMEEGREFMRQLHHGYKYRGRSR